MQEGIQNGTAHWKREEESILWSLTETLPHYPATSLPDKQPQRNENIELIKILCKCSYSLKTEATQMSTNWWTDKQNVVVILWHKNKMLLLRCISTSKRSQTQKSWYRMTPFTGNPRKHKPQEHNVDQWRPKAVAWAHWHKKTRRFRIHDGIFLYWDLVLIM